MGEESLVNLHFIERNFEDVLIKPSRASVPFKYAQACRPGNKDIPIVNCVSLRQDALVSIRLIDIPGKILDANYWESGIGIIRWLEGISIYIGCNIPQPNPFPDKSGFIARWR